MPDVPVAMGAKKPLIVPIWELGSGVHGADGRGNTNLPPPKLESDDTCNQHILS